MCWRYYTSIDNKRHIAKTDIRTFKILRLEKHTLCAYYQNYDYTIGKLNSVNSLELIGNKIFEGFHSYNLKNDCDCASVLESLMMPSLEKIIRVQNKKGMVLDYYLRANHIVKVECIIPKGSEYYENSLGEIVSNKLIVDKIISEF